MNHSFLEAEPTNRAFYYMTDVARLKQQARLIQTHQRKVMLAGMPETDLHHALASLIRAMNPEYWVEVTHSSREFGKDLVIVRSDPLMPDVCGVVVKRGPISGKTLGDVDEIVSRVQQVQSGGKRVTEEILSQIRQAKKHTAELTGYILELQCNRVMVILAGDMSSQARRRLEAEVGPLGVVHDVAWLVTQFTEFYPQVFFEAQVVDFLSDAIARLDVDSFHAKSGKSLTECFVEPVITPADKELFLDNATNLVRVKHQRLRFAQLGGLIGTRRRVLLVGDPGSGKSKVAAKFCIDAYRAALHHMTKREDEDAAFGIPLMVPARRFDTYASADELLHELLPETVRNRLEATTLVLDGLDELPHEERDRVLGKAEEFADALKTSLFVTSRRLAGLAVAPRGFSRYEIMPFEVGQAMKLVNKVLLKKDVLPKLKRGIESVQSQLVMTPLSLILLIEVVVERKEVPASVTELYERFLDLVFGRWDQEKGIDVVFEYVVKKRFLGTLAYEEFFLKDRLEISAAEFDAFLKRYAAKYAWDENRFRAFVKEIDRAGVLDTQNDVFFRHRSFLEFFVGHYINEQRAELPDVASLVVNTYYNELWTEASFFYTGLIRDITDDVLDGLLQHESSDSDLPIQKLMIGRLLQAGWHSPTAIKERGIKGSVASVPDAVRRTREHLRTLKRSVPSFFGDIVALYLAENAYGSLALTTEAERVLNDLQSSKEASEEALLKEAALLWALRGHTGAATHAETVRKYLEKLSEAKLPPHDEARFLVLAGLSDPAADVRKLIGRRIRRLEADTPSAIAGLLPSKRPRFKPPDKTR